MAWYSLLDSGDIAVADPNPIDGTAASPGASGQLADRDHVHAFAPVTTLDMNAQRLSNLGAPVGANDAARKADIDAVSAGISWKQAVRAATTGNVSLTGEQAIDGVACVAGDRVLVKSQTNGAENGLYLVASGAWTRAPDADAADELEAAAVFVEEGAVNADSAWVQTADDPVLGTTPLTFTQFSGLGQITAGAGLSKTGNQLDVNPDGASIEISGDALRVKAGGIGGSHLAANAVTADKIQAGAVGASEIAAGAVGNDELASGAVTDAEIAAGAGISLSKLATDPLSRANHTGSQSHATISDFDAGVRTNRLDQMGVPTNALNLNLQEVHALVLEPFTTAARPAPVSNQRLIFNTTIGRVQIDR